MVDPTQDLPAPWSDRTESSGVLAATLPARLVFTLLRGVVRTAARFQLPLAELLDLARLAYFEELRRRHPRSLAQVARRLGLSVRQVSNLKRQLATAFFDPENEARPLRLITELLGRSGEKGSGEKSAEQKSFEEIAAALEHIDREDLRRALDVVCAAGWATRSADDTPRYRLTEGLRVHIDRTLTRRLDGLAHQLELLADGVWAGFVEPPHAERAAEAYARSWVFSACPAQLEAFAEETIKRMRYGAIDLDEATKNASDGAPSRRYGATIMIGDLTAAVTADDVMKDDE